mmetsp:Transcript_66706/g.168276  ORF Transcript_66706/g.168276 Transcript_66706/m.168276 type:complete len:265 (+) Transcript_66706:1260-2054(+)
MRPQPLKADGSSRALRKDSMVLSSPNRFTKYLTCDICSRLALNVTRLLSLSDGLSFVERSVSMPSDHAVRLRNSDHAVRPRDSVDESCGLSSCSILPAPATSLCSLDAPAAVAIASLDMSAIKTGASPSGRHVLFASFAPAAMLSLIIPHTPPPTWDGCSGVSIPRKASARWPSRGAEGSSRSSPKASILRSIVAKRALNSSVKSCICPWGLPHVCADVASRRYPEESDVRLDIAGGFCRLRSLNCPSSVEPGGENDISTHRRG